MAEVRVTGRTGACGAPGATVTAERYDSIERTGGSARVPRLPLVPGAVGSSTSDAVKVERVHTRRRVTTTQRSAALSHGRRS